MQDRDNASIIEWLKEWAAAIRENDLSRGRSLFSDNASGFGTITFMTHSLDDLVKRQWTDIWSKTRDFDFEWDQIKIHASGDGLQAAIQSPWSSIGKDEKEQDRRRNGRATIVLTRSSKSDEWKCIHTHFSMWPGGADDGLMK